VTEQIIDYTAMRLGKKTHIAVCPKCGRRGEVIWYSHPANKGRTIHKARRECFGLVVLDMCEFAKAGG